jgi:hypothetical protein
MEEPRKRVKITRSGKVIILFIFATVIWSMFDHGQVELSELWLSMWEKIRRVYQKTLENVGLA